jgi:hypothetical protein
MMNWKGCGRKRSWPNLKALFQHFVGETKENHETRHLSQTISWPRFERGTFRIRSRSVNHSTTTFRSHFLARAVIPSTQHNGQNDSVRKHPYLLTKHVISSAYSYTKQARIGEKSRWGRVTNAHTVPSQWRNQTYTIGTPNKYIVLP